MVFLFTSNKVDFWCMIGRILTGGQIRCWIDKMNGYKLEVGAIISTFYLEVLVSSTQHLLVERALKLHTFLSAKKLQLLLTQIWIT